MGLFDILIIAAMILLNGVFAAYELALASIQPSRLRQLAEQRRAGAATAVAMKDRIEGSLAVVQLGITLVGAIAAATGGANVEENVAPRIEQSLGVSGGVADFLALTLFIIPLSAATIIIGELAPKVFALKNPEPVCLWLSPPMRVFAQLAWPAVWAFELTTKALVATASRLTPLRVETEQSHLNELRAQVGMMRASRLIGPQQERIIVQAARLSAVRVHQIMVDVQDIVTLHAEAPLTESIIAAHMDLHTRFPVTERKGDPQAIIGYVNIKEMVFLAKTHPHNPVLREIIRPMPALSHDLPASDALTQMAAAHTHLALVKDAAGQVTGLIALEDIFEELVGEIPDELDRLPRHLTPSGRQWIVGGAISLGRLRETFARPELGEKFPAEMTLNDFLAAQHSAARRFKGGDILTVDGLNVLVRKVRRQKIAEALIEPAAGAS